MQSHLESTEIIDWKHPAVIAKAHALAVGAESVVEIATRCFEFVRDAISHSADAGRPESTLSASEVLEAGTGVCFAKSHLLAGLLRANAIPAGLCYQRFLREDGSHGLHGLNAVHLPEAGWYRMDARGNRPGVNAQFTPPVERLAFSADGPGEMLLPEIWPGPLEVVVQALRYHQAPGAPPFSSPDIVVMPETRGIPTKKPGEATVEIENTHFAPFFTRQPLVVERGEGVHVWDVDGRRYLDLTAGWGVTCLGHASPVITRALVEQSAKILQTPNAGTTYSPPRAQLLDLLATILPEGLTRVFFTNSGAEANDAAMKLARKASGRKTVISTEGSFHGRTISTVSATGQAKHREPFQPLMPGHVVVPYNDIEAVAHALDDDVAAVIVEPVQGEGGVVVPDDGYLPAVAELCAQAGAYLIVDEVQTGFCRTGPMFAVDRLGVRPDFLCLAKGLGGGFPIGAFAMTEAVASRLEKGDHGGTYCGNPLGCRVAHDVIRALIDDDVAAHVETLGKQALATMQEWQEQFPEIVRDVRGRGLLLAAELDSDETAARAFRLCLDRGVVINIIQGRVLRVFPALTITEDEVAEALGVIESVLSEL